LFLIFIFFHGLFILSRSFQNKSYKRARISHKTAQKGFWKKQAEKKQAGKWLTEKAISGG
jgi:lipopolysaccharide export LptBFGC system permease protein LptF